MSQRESYWDYMGRKIRENRNVELSLVEKVKSLEERVKKLEELERKIDNMSKSFKRTRWKPTPFDG